MVALPDPGSTQPSIERQPFGRFLSLSCLSVHLLPCLCQVSVVHIHVRQRQRVMLKNELSSCSRRQRTPT